MTDQQSGLHADLSGQVAIVTGASQGLGKAIAVTLGKNGAQVACLARNQEKLETDIHIGLKDTLNILVHKLRTGNVSVTRSFGEDLPQPAINPGELNQVWTNLIDNAIDALEDTPSPTIAIRTFRNH